MKRTIEIFCILLLLFASNSFAQVAEDLQTDTGTINSHEWVDLGLSVKWATCNLGASYPEDYGDYYAWGEIRPKAEYTKDNSITYGKSIGVIAGNPQYDAARANWGGTWRLPTKSEIDELVNKCTWTWTTQGDHNGYKGTGPNGNSIFFPAAGLLWGKMSRKASFSRMFGYYWSATPDEHYTDYVYGIFFTSSNFLRDDTDTRYEGRTVRPVSD